MTPQTVSLSAIPDNKPVRVYLPIKNHRRRYRTQAVFTSITGSEFELRFQPGTLPINNLNPAESCLINVDFGGPNISMQASISSTEGHTLRMHADRLISHDQVREFFRVDAVTEVLSKSFHTDFFNSTGKPWTLKGKTIDISGSGILAVFEQQPPEEEPVRLDLTLPTDNSDIISILASPVRTSQIDDSHWETAYHFQEISDEDRDRIVGCCLEIQRKFLRLSVTAIH